MNELILFSTVRSALGMALVAKSERGLCALLLGDDVASLVRDLRRRFPGADLREEAVFDRQVKALLENPASKLDLPLDLRGSDF